MGTNFGKVFSSAFRYAFDFRRILPFFIINLVMVASILLFIDSAINFIPLLMMSNFNLSALNLIFSAMIILTIFVIGQLLVIFFRGAITDNARLYWQKRKSILSKSYPIAKKKYITVLVTLILTGLITGFINSILELIPFIGGFFSFIVGIFFAMIFLFLIQIIIISNKGVIASIKDGYRLFMKNPLDVFIFLIIFVILTLILFLIAFIPIMIALIPIMMPLMGFMTNPANISAMLGNMIVAVKANMFILTVAGAISSLLFAYLSVFQEAAKTFFYVQKKRK